MWLSWLTNKSFGWPQETRKFSHWMVGRKERSILSLIDEDVRKATGTHIQLVVDPGWILEVPLTQRHRSCGSVPQECSYAAPKGRVSPEAICWFSQSTGPQLTLTQCWGPPALRDAVTLACEFPSWVLAFHGYDDSLTTMFLLTHPICVCFSALWDTVASAAESTADSVSYSNAFTSLGEA